MGAVCFRDRSRTTASISNTTPLLLVRFSIAGYESPVKVLSITLGGEFEPTPLPQPPFLQQKPRFVVSLGTVEYEAPVKVIHRTLGETGTVRSSTDSSCDLQCFNSAIPMTITCLSIPTEGLSSAVIAALTPATNALNPEGSSAATTVLSKEV